jgi:hypothetical protein
MAGSRNGRPTDEQAKSRTIRRMSTTTTANRSAVLALTALGRGGALRESLGGGLNGRAGRVTIVG